jgi:hypothetical protein
MRPVDLLEQIHQAIPSHSDCHGTTRIMYKRGPTSGKDAHGVSLLAGLLATVDEVIEGIVLRPSVALRVS